jgi:stearoyl-CoA 9-desaturase NADPH oxidoreductase
MRVRNLASLLSTPLVPDDFIELINPLWSRRQLAGRVVAVRRETADSATITIRPGAGWRGHHAGQHVTVGVEIDGVRHQRTYSLTSPPHAPGGHIAITAKAVRGGVVSHHLAHRIAPGAVVHLGQAAGDFTLPDAPRGPLLFITAGSGITPVMGMLRALARTGRSADVAIVHVDRDPGSVIFARELRGLADRGSLRLHEHHTARLGRPSPAQLVERVADWRRRRTWACGPPELLDAVHAHFAAAGTSERLTVERFADARMTGAPRASGARGGRVTFARSGVAVDASGDTTLLAAGEAAGALLPSGCRMGICRTCVGRLRAGVVRDARTGEIGVAPGDVVQTCVSVADGPVEVEL